MKLFRFIVFLLTSLIVTGCGSVEEVPFELTQAIEDYYLKEKEQDWKRLYNYRRSEFRETVPYQLFEKKMTDYAEEVSLDGYDIKDIHLDNSEAVVVMDITDRISPKNGSELSAVFKSIVAFQGEKTAKWTQRNMISKWININGRWFLLDSDRMFQPLTRQMVYDS